MLAMWMDHSGAWWVVMWLSMLVFWSLVLFGAWALFSQVGAEPRDRRHSAEDILAERLARGEISREDYHALLDDLREGGHGRAHPAPH
jgi:uncharacterized membrane protein